jgi:hypothetical protein
LHKDWPSEIWDFGSDGIGWHTGAMSLIAWLASVPC